MSATEYRAWQALAMIEAQVQALVAQGTKYETAVRMAWTRPPDDDPPDVIDD